MNLAILGLGTAVPPTRLPLANAEKVARAMCAATPEQAEALSALYRQTAIANRHILFSPDVVRDIIEGTRHSGSPFLPTGEPGHPDPGPTTAVRMQTYCEHAL